MSAELPTIDPIAAGLDPAALQRIDDYIRSWIEDGMNFSGSVIVGRGGKVAHRSHIGEVAPGRLAASGDRYMLMSLTKAMTATLVLQAVDAGRFGLDTKVVEILPEYAGGGKDAGTIRQVLCHTAGLPTAFVAPPLPMTAAGDLTRAGQGVCDLDAVYAPGSRCAYTSGTGYDLLGYILERTDPASRSLRDIARDDVFAPLGMDDSSFGCALDDPRRVPVRATTRQTTPIVELMNGIFNGLDEDSEYPCAGVFATLDDVFRFAESFAGRGPDGYRVCSPRLFDEASRIATGDLPLEAVPAAPELAGAQMVATVGPERAQEIGAAMQKVMGAAKEPGARAPLPEALAARGPYPANFTLLGGYARGTGDYFSSAGPNAPATALTAVGGGSTGFYVDTENDLTVAFVSAGLAQAEHPGRLARINELALDSIRA